MKDYQVRTECASCGGTDIKTILDLKEVPLAGYFPTAEEREKELKYKLELKFCLNCYLVQTDSMIAPDILFKDYRYLSSVSLTKHFKSYASWLDQHYGVKEKQILEIGSNDGVLLSPLKELGANAMGIDPAVNVVEVARKRGLTVINDYFSTDAIEKYDLTAKFDYIISNNAFAHITDITGVVKGLQLALKQDGFFIFEVHYLEKLISEKQWDNIYHEHIYYYSLNALKNLLAPYGLVIVDFLEIPIHAGSIRVVAQKKENPKLSEAVTKQFQKEIDLGLTSLSFYKDYAVEVSEHIVAFKALLAEEHKKGKKIAGYGASGRANMFCNILGMSSKDVAFIVDESPERCGRYIANTDIPIVSKEHLLQSDIDTVIIFAWNYSKMIIEKLTEQGYTYIVAFPFPQQVKHYEELKGFVSI